MKQNPPPPWPPIIEFTRAPWWLRLRDIALTIAAWALLAYLLRRGIAIVIDYFSAPIFRLTRTQAPDWAEIWHRLQPFVILALIAILWLALWGLLHRRRLQFAARQTPPTPLPLAQHAASFDFGAADLERWRAMKIAVVQFDADHRIAGVNPPIAAREDSSLE